MNEERIKQLGDLCKSIDGYLVSYGPYTEEEAFHIRSIIAQRIRVKTCVASAVTKTVSTDST